MVPAFTCHWVRKSSNFYAIEMMIFFYAIEIVEPCLYLLPLWLSHFHNNNIKSLIATHHPKQIVPSYDFCHKGKENTNKNLRRTYFPRLTFIYFNAFSWIKCRFQWFRTWIKIINRKLYTNFKSALFIIELWLCDSHEIHNVYAEIIWVT